MKSRLKISLGFLILNYKPQNPPNKTRRSEGRHKWFPLPWPLGQPGLCCLLKLIKRQSRLQEHPLLLLEPRWFSTARFELSLATAPHGCFPQRVGPTHRVKEMMANSPAPTCELHGAGAAGSHRAGRDRGSTLPVGNWDRHRLLLADLCQRELLQKFRLCQTPPELHGVAVNPPVAPLLRTEKGVFPLCLSHPQFCTFQGTACFHLPFYLSLGR